jgi:hypothetical protein
MKILTRKSYQALLGKIQQMTEQIIHLDDSLHNQKQENKELRKIINEYRNLIKPR